MAGEFSDDDWDFTADQLEELEHNAILSTQQQQGRNGQQIRQDDHSVGHSVAPQQYHGQRHTNGNNINVAQVDPRRAAAGTGLNRQAGIPSTRQASVAAADSFDNPSLDEDGVPLVVEEQPRAFKPGPRQTDETTDRERWRQGRYTQQTEQRPIYQRNSMNAVPRKAAEEYRQRMAAKENPKPTSIQSASQRPQPPSRTVSTDDIPMKDGPQSNALSEFEALRVAKEALEREKEELLKQLYTAQGEVAIVRNKTTMELKMAERRTDVLKKQMQEEVHKHQAALKSKEAAYNDVVTSNNFLKHDLEEQTRKASRLQQQAKGKNARGMSNDFTVSPRKAFANNSINDGFDDDVMIVDSLPSPRKRPTSKSNTPNKKRKHPDANGINTNAIPFRLTQDVATVHEMEAGKQKPESMKDFTIEENLQFMKSMLAYRPHQGKENTIESLTHHTLLGLSPRPLSSTLLEDAQALKAEKLPRNLLLIFVRMLSHCHEQKQYKPVNLLLDCVLGGLHLDPTLIDKEFMETTIPIMQQLIMYNASKRYLLGDRTRIWSVDKPKPKEDPDVSVNSAVEVLFTIASYLLDEPVLLKLFWQWVDTETLLILLQPSQRLPDIMATLDMLSTSVMSDTFGIISKEFQARTEAYIIDKVVFLLWDPPRRYVRNRFEKAPTIHPARKRLEAKMRAEPEPAPEPDLTRLQICHLRLKAMEVLTNLVLASVPHPISANIEKHHGTTVMLQQVNAVARMVRFLYDEVSELYAKHPDTHELHARLINNGVALLHHLLLSPQAIGEHSDFDLSKTLSGTLVGHHKFIVVMTRLALGRDASAEIPEDQGLDSGITDTTRDYASDILGQYVTPDEATRLTVAFGLADLEDADAMETEEDTDAMEAAAMAEQGGAI